MKAWLYIFLLFPFICLSQEQHNKAEEKPSTTDCPSWKKKDKKVGKAEYFQYLRTSKPSSKKSTAYTTSKTDSKVQPNMVQQVTKKSTAKESTAEHDTKTTEVISDKPGKENQASKVDKRERELVNSVDEHKEKKVVDKTKDQEKPVVAVKEEVQTENKAVVEEEVEKKSATEEKIEDKKTKLKQRLARLTRKTTKVRKHSNAKCPSF